MYTESKNGKLCDFHNDCIEKEEFACENDVHTSFRIYKLNSGNSN